MLGSLRKLIAQGGTRKERQVENEALEILKMVRESTVTPEQGQELLAALKSQPAGAMAGGGERPRFLRVRVNVLEKEGKGDKVDVNLNLPVAMADVALKMLEQAKITKGGETIQFGDYLKDLQGMDVSAILQMVKEGAEGKLVDVNVDSEDGDKVRVEVIVD
jgi:hypothetical protein